jgi:hypothetical protein
VPSERHDPLGVRQSQLIADHRERPARAATVVEQQAGAVGRRAGGLPQRTV